METDKIDKNNQLESFLKVVKKLFSSTFTTFENFVNNYYFVKLSENEVKIFVSPNFSSPSVLATVIEHERLIEIIPLVDDEGWDEKPLFVTLEIVVHYIIDYMVYIFDNFHRPPNNHNIDNRSWQKYQKYRKEYLNYLKYLFKLMLTNLCDNSRDVSTSCWEKPLQEFFDKFSRTLIEFYDQSDDSQSDDDLLKLIFCNLPNFHITIDWFVSQSVIHFDKSIIINKNDKNGGTPGKKFRKHYSFDVGDDSIKYKQKWIENQCYLIGRYISPHLVSLSKYERSEHLNDILKTSREKFIQGQEEWKKEKQEYLIYCLKIFNTLKSNIIIPVVKIIIDYSF